MTSKSQISHVNSLQSVVAREETCHHPSLKLSCHVSPPLFFPCRGFGPGCRPVHPSVVSVDRHLQLKRQDKTRQEKRKREAASHTETSLIHAADPFSFYFFFFFSFFYFLFLFFFVLVVVLVVVVTFKRDRSDVCCAGDPEHNSVK
jgi:hypothetical protein